MRTRHEHRFSVPFARACLPSAWLPAASLLAPLAVATAQAAPDWQLEPTPPSRNAFTIVRHEGIDEAVLFGGEVYEAMDDTWLWNGTGWRRVASPQSPSRRYFTAMVYDSTRDRVVLFGGSTGQATVGDTWAFDGAAWSQLAPAQSPSPRNRHAMGYDPVRDRVVLRGGLSAPLGGSLSDLWEFDGTTWQFRPQAGSLPSNNNGQFVFDAARQELLLIGDGVLAWDGTAWSPRSTTGLPANTFGQVVYDSVGQRVLLFTTSQQNAAIQEVWAYAGQDWTLLRSVAVPSDRYVGFAYDSARAEAVGLRGALGPGNDDRSHTFVWSGVTEPGTGWQQVRTGLPPARRSAAMGYDPVRRRMVLHGGGEGIFTTDQIYEADGREWLPRWPVGGPGVAAHGMVHDTASGSMLIFGSEGGSNGIRAWNGSALVFLSGSNTLPLRYWNALAYDTQRQRMLVFGGETNQGLTDELWAWSGSAWQNLTTPGPEARRQASLCYDPGRDRLVLFGGTDGGSYFGDTWEHDGISWSQRTPATAPTARADAVFVYADHLQRCVLVGGYDEGDLRDTWLWDGSEWQQLVTDGVPDTGTGICGAYDPDRREVVLFGGGTYVGTNPRRNRGELWRLRDPSLATWSRSGFGCDAGAGLLRLEALDPPALDRTCRFELQNTPAQFVALPIAWIGFDDQQFGGLPLPISLAALGAPGCFVWADAQVPVPLLPDGLRAIGSFTLPDQPAAIGVRLFLQGAVWNFGSATVATADLLTGIVGPL